MGKSFNSDTFHIERPRPMIRVPEISKPFERYSRPVGIEGDPRANSAEIQDGMLVFYPAAEASR